MDGARDALEPLGTGLTGSRLLNGTLDLHLELEREIAEWMGTEDAIVFTTGHQANVGTLGTSCSARRHRRRRLGRPRLDPRRLPAVTGQAAPVPPQPARQARELLERAAEDGGGVLVVVDGVFSMEGDVAPLPAICDLCRAPRRAADGRRGARGRRARRPRRGDGGAVRRRGPGRPADGHVLEVARLVRRLRGRHARGDRLPADPVARVPVHRRRPSPRRSARRSPRCGSSAPPTGRRCSPRCSRTPPT